MDIKYQIRGLKKLQLAAREAPGLLAVMNKEALESATEMVKAGFIQRTPTGPGHFGFHLVNRIFTRVRFGPRRSVGIVATNDPVGRWREFGTKAHDIAPRQAKELALGGSDAAGFAAIVHHPGSKAFHTMRNALRAAKPAIQNSFQMSAQAVVKRMAGKE